MKSMRQRFSNNMRNVLFQHHAKDVADRLSRDLPLLGNLETLPPSFQLDRREGFDHLERQGSVANSVPVGSLVSFVPLVLTSLLVATISGTAAYTSLIANPPGKSLTNSDKDITTFAIASLTLL